ncbi:MAG TPA: phosphoglucomutase (alpha-D-glucose-1,6-bisphosphate-dependent) [Tepidisphaeraceae bacterium]|jgi:phosphoglucomutase|nr:phosphoglucomutase (alpha-D-glucose-1,6-bisphosphate-dependent) [Tepidisphaeraceae bacterium]
MPSPLAGKPPPASLLIDPAALERAYYSNKPDPANPLHKVSFGTSGHRGSPDDSTFTESHILAITQAICEYRASKGINGPLYLGKDTHAADQPATRTALEVLAANNVETIIAKDDDYVPTPVISHAILTYNRNRTAGLADGIIVTPSHNPPRDGGFKYNPPHGGPADTDVTKAIQDRANAILAAGLKDVKRIPYEQAIKSVTTHAKDLITPYVEDLSNVIDFDVIRHSNLRIGADPLGGASVHYWQPIADRYNLNLTVVNPNVDFTFKFMTVDHDGQIRMDCSSPDAMASLIKLKDQYDIAFGNDTDADRHGIVAPSVGLLNPNHFLAVAIQYLFTHRPNWPKSASVGKTLVSSSIIDRVASSLSRKLYEVPVGFKWFSPGLFDGSLGFGGEESAGASFLRRDGSVWTTDKDGLILGLLAAEITAATGKDPGLHYKSLESQFGTSFYKRIDVPATKPQKSLLSNLSPESVTDTQLAGEPITAKMTNAPANNAPIGGLKVSTKNGWFAARPSGTEDVYKIYAESLTSQSHLDSLLKEAQSLVTRVLSPSRS